MSNETKIDTINKSLNECLFAVHGPINDHNLLKDLYLKIDLYREILNGIAKRAQENSLTTDDINSAIKYWNNMRINLDRALGLLECVSNTIESENVNLEECNNIYFPIDEEFKERLENCEELESDLSRLIDIESWEKKHSSKV